ncbi:hypothetical protein [Streptomyces sp. A5-4]|uniref:hypothetical protein n=1 Tax=Streptomyces sp. A5-4 TaxID=3384771 RepID=UPI003DAA280D
MSHNIERRTTVVHAEFSTIEICDSQGAISPGPPVAVPARHTGGLARSGLMPQLEKIQAIAGAVGRP